MTWGPTLRRRSRPVTVAKVLLVLAVATVTLVGVARVELDTRMESFLPADDPEVTAWLAQQRSFGGDPLVVVIESEEPEALLAPPALPALLRLEGELARLPDVAVLYGPATTVNQIAGQAQSLLVELTGRRDGMRAQAEQAALAGGASPEQAAAAATEATREFDRRYGSLLVSALPVGLPTLQNPGFARAVVFEPDGDVRSQLRFLVPDRTHVTVLVRPRESLDQAAIARLVSTVGEIVEAADLPASEIVITGAPAISSALAAQVTDEMPLLAAAAGLAVLLSFLIMGAGRNRRRKLLPLAQMLVGLAVTYAAFGWSSTPVTIGGLAAIPILVGVNTDLPIYVQRGTSSRLVLAVTLASAVGYLVLLASPLPFVRQLGLALAIGVTVSAALALLTRRSGAVEATEAADPTARRRPRRPVGLPSPWRRGGLVAGVLLATAGWALLPGIRVDADPLHLAGDLAVVRTAQETERLLGASGELAVTLHAPDVLDPEVLRWFAAAEERLVVDFGDRLRPIVTPHRLLGWLGADATSQQIEAAVRLFPPYLLSASVRSDRTEAVATFGLPLDDLADQSALISAIRSALPEAPPGAEVGVTGLPVVAGRGYDLVAGQRVLPNVAGIALFGLVLLLVLRDPRVAVRAGAAAAIAFGWGVLVLDVTNTALTPLTITLGTLTAAVGGEFAVVAGGLRRRDRGWPAIIAAVVTSSAGFLALGLSQVAVLRGFGLVLAGSVLLAAPAAWLVTPAAARPSTEPASPAPHPQRAVDRPDGRSLAGVAR
jgi:hypothetical protein